MVEDRRHALLDGVDVKRGGGGARAVHHQVAVDGPPCAVKDFVEVRRVVADDGKAAGEGRVDMRVRVDERGHDDAAPGVNDLGTGIFCAQRRLFADFDDLRPLKGDGAVLVIPLRARVAGDETTVGDKFHKFAPPFSFAFSTFISFFSQSGNSISIFIIQKICNLSLLIWIKMSISVQCDTNIFMT